MDEIWLKMEQKSARYVVDLNVGVRERSELGERNELTSEHGRVSQAREKKRKEKKRKGAGCASADRCQLAVEAGQRD